MLLEVPEMYLVELVRFNEYLKIVGEQLVVVSQ